MKPDEEGIADRHCVDDRPDEDDGSAPESLSVASERSRLLRSKLLRSWLCCASSTPVWTATSHVIGIALDRAFCLHSDFPGASGTARKGGPLNSCKTPRFVLN